MAKKATGPRVQVVYDTDPSVPEAIESYVHCARCLDEWKESFSGVMSPRDYARIQVGIQSNGNIQVVCTRHNCNVAVLAFTVVAA